MPIIAIKAELQIRTRNGFDKQSLTELAASIAELGILEPLIVRPHATDEAQFILIAGERRLMAASMAGLADVPVLIRNTTDIETATIQAVENLQRENLGLADMADGVAALLKDYKTPKAVAKALGKSTAWVSKHMAVTRLTPVVREIIDEGKTEDMEILLGLDKIGKRPKGLFSVSLSATMYTLHRNWRWIEARHEPAPMLAVRAMPTGKSAVTKAAFSEIARTVAQAIVVR